MNTTFPYDIFLSHSSKDKAVVRPLAERLRADGLKVWPCPPKPGEGGFDEWVLRPGDSIPAKIEDGLEQSRVLVLCMSANAFGSDWAQLACPAVASERRRKAGPYGRDNLPFRDPLNSAFAQGLRRDTKERRFIPLRLDDTPIKGSLEQFFYAN